MRRRQTGAVELSIEAIVVEDAAHSPLTDDSLTAEVTAKLADFLAGERADGKKPDISRDRAVAAQIAQEIHRRIPR